MAHEQGKQVARAVYRDGVLVPSRPLDLAEGTPVRLTLRERSGQRQLVDQPSRFSARMLALGIALSALLITALITLFARIDPGDFAPLWSSVSALRTQAASRPGLLLAAPIALGVLGAAILLLARRRAALPAALIVLALGAGFAGEALALRERFGASAWTLLAAAVLLAAAMAIGRDRLAAVFESAPLPRRREAVLLALVLLAFLFTHFLAIGRHPYGVEGDESSWVRKVVESSADDDPERYHFQFIPVTYWLQRASNAALGVDIAKVRLTVALLGLAATLVFYAAVRAMANAPVALLATALMAFSIVDIAAGRQAHPEAYVKIFGIVGAAGVVLGYARRERWWFALAGVALGLGLWTYDSFALAPWGLFAYAVFRLVREPRAWRFHLHCLLLLAIPLAAMAWQVKPYLDGRRDAQITVLTTAIGEDPSTLAGWMGAMPRVYRFVADQAGVAQRRVTHQGLNDVLIGRRGPLESAAYVPLVLLGIVVALFFWRRGQLVFPLFWAAVPALPTLFLLGQTFARTLLPYWGAFLVLGAYTLWLAYRAVVDALGTRWAKWVAGGLIAGVAVTGVSNAYVAFNELYDPLERQLRRELGERLQRHAAPDNLILMPYAAFAQDYFDLERWYTRYALAEQAVWGEEEKLLRQVEIGRLFAEMRTAFAERQRVTVLYDRSIDRPEARAEVLAALTRCFPAVEADRGQRIDAYVVTRAAYDGRVCDVGAAIEPQAPLGDSVSPGAPLEFRWRLDGTAQSSYELVLERHDDRVLWFEAEDFATRDGWQPEGHLAPAFSGRAYLADQRTGERPLVTARHALPVPESGAYALWARVYRRRDDGGPIRLDVAGRSIDVGAIPPDQFNQWVWQPLGEVTLDAGASELTLERSYPDANVVFQIFIDVLVFSRAPGFDPARDGEWTSFLDTGTVTSSEPRHALEAGVPDGRYRWRVRVRNGERLVDWKGTPVLASPDAEFTATRAPAGGRG
jgi:predicted DNA-binding antitoxin AbrB/MazE fold protein